MDAIWSPLSAADVRERFADAGVPWWTAGGVAIDLFLGWETRPHDDIDVEMLRRDRMVLFDVFSGWDLHAVSEGRLIAWTGQDLARDVFGIWGRPDPSSAWAVEVMLADGDDTTWRFRRDPEISLPLADLVHVTGVGMPYCTPEVQLLYKAKRNRPKDDADLARCLHRLAPSQCRWLADAIARAQPGHAWIPVLHHAAERAT